MRLHDLSVPLALSLAFALAATTASADLPPPAGTKRVDYSFEVKNLLAFTDFVMLAYPTSASNGRPTYELAEVQDGNAVECSRLASSWRN